MQLLTGPVELINGCGSSLVHSGGEGDSILLIFMALKPDSFHPDEFISTNACSVVQPSNHFLMAQYFSQICKQFQLQNSTRETVANRLRDAMKRADTAAEIKAYNIGTILLNG